MKIQGLPPFDGGVRKVVEKKQDRTASVESPKTSDTVKLTGGGSSIERMDAQYAVPAEFPVRSEVIRAVEERISRKEYNEPEMQESVAVSIVNSLGGIQSSGGMSSPELAPERTEQVQTAHVQANEGYYNRPEVLDALAERLIGTQGLASLFRR